MSNKRKKERDEFEEMKLYLGKTKKLITQNKSKYIIVYCRVSSSKQIDNYSIDNQLNDIKKYAKENGLTIVKIFKVDGESSKRGSKRPSVDDLLQFIKETKYEIREIVVFHSDRFARDGAFGDKFLDKIISKGIGFNDLDDPNDIFTELGKIKQANAFYEAEKSNIVRKKYINTTTIKKLKLGYTMRKPPLGYRGLKIGKGKDKKQKIIITEQGKLIKQAFQLKLDYNYSNVMIAEMMSQRGLDITHKQLGLIFKNPYYCGTIRDSRLIESNGLAQGRHPKIITWEEHKIINNLGNTKKRAIRKSDIDDLPLRKHLICSKCNCKLTGYPASKRKDLFYYKCRTQGCKVNTNTKIIHELYSDLLKQFSFNKTHLPQLTKDLGEVFKILNKSNRQLKKELTTKIGEEEKERKNAIRNMNSYPEDRKLYKELVSDCDNRIKGLNEQLVQIRIGIEEINNNTIRALQLVNDLPSIWNESDFKLKVRLQELIFPDGVTYHKKSNILKPVQISPIFGFIKDFKEKNKLNHTDKIIQNFQENKAKVRTQNLTGNKAVTSIKTRGYGSIDEVENSEKIQLVPLPSSRSNNFDHTLFDSMDELIRFTELYTLINNNK